MAATVNITSYHGAAAGTSNDIDGTTFRFKLADNDTVDLLTPVTVPASGTNYSWIKQTRFRATSTPSNLINNLLFYTDGTNGFGTGISLFVKTSASYTNPITQAASALSGTASAFGYTVGAPLAITGSLSNPSTGAFGDYLQLQMAVASTASPGTAPGETLTWSYDEQ